MQILHTINQARDFRATSNTLGKKIALVPTMGGLHAGHLSLVEEAKKITDTVIATIFVNKMQFGPNEDFGNYPRTLESDLEKLKNLGTNAVFIPSMDEMYPNSEQKHTKVCVPHLDGIHCGKTRPQFFTGIATIVTKLFNILQPDYAIFGEKDFQQLQIIKQLAKDLCFPIEIYGAPTIREKNGLAMSSRNSYLGSDQYDTASKLYQIICNIKTAIIEGERNYAELEKTGKAQLTDFGLAPDYINIVNSETLLSAKPEDKSLRILAAAILNGARLIDNVSISLLP